MGVRAEVNGSWLRKKDTPDGPKGQTGDSSDMPKGQAAGA